MFHSGHFFTKKEHTQFTFNLNFAFVRINPLQAFRFIADKELMREPRVVRVGLIQNSIVIPTTSPFSDQKKAIFNKIKTIIDAAGASGVNVLCLQVGQAQEKSDLIYYSNNVIKITSYYILFRKLGRCPLLFAHGRRDGVSLQSPLMENRRSSFKTSHGDTTWSL